MKSESIFYWQIKRLICDRTHQNQPFSKSLSCNCFYPIKNWANFKIRQFGIQMRFILIWHHTIYHVVVNHCSSHVRLEDRCVVALNTSQKYSRGKKVKSGLNKNSPKVCPFACLYRGDGKKTFFQPSYSRRAWVLHTGVCVIPLSLNQSRKVTGWQAVKINRFKVTTGPINL